MPDVNPFDAVFGQQKPQQSQSAPVSQPAPSGGGNPFDTVFGPGKHTQPDQTPATSTHGALYNASDSVLNSPLPGKTDSGHPMLDQIGDSLKSLNPIDMGRGIVKGALSTAAGVGSIVNKLTGAQQPFNQSNLSGLTDANNAGQGIGKYGEQAAELMGGEGVAAKTMPGLLGKMATSGAISGVQSGGDPTAAVLGTALPAAMSSKAAQYAGKAVSKVLGMTSGAGDAAIARAYLHPDSSGLAKVMRGELSASDVVDNLQKSVTNFRDSAAQEYKGSLDKVTSQSIPGWHAKAGQALQNINDALTDQLKKFGAVETAGGLDTKHLTGATSDEVQTLVNTVRNWGSEARDMTPAGLDTLKKKLGEVAGDTNSALANRLYDTAKQEANKIIPGYQEMTTKYATASDMLRTMKKTLNVSASGDTNKNTVVGKIQNMLKQNTNYRQTVLEKLPNSADLLDQIAGLHLNDTMPKGILKSLIGADAIGGMAFHSPAISAAAIPAAAMASPRTVGEIARGAGKIAQSGLPVRDTARRAVTAGANGMLSGSN